MQKTRLETRIEKLLRLSLVLIALVIPLATSLRAEAATVKVQGWTQDYFGRPLNGVTVKYYAGAQLLGSATSAFDQGHDGYFSMDVNNPTNLTLKAVSPVNCYGFSVTLPLGWVYEDITSNDPSDQNALVIKSTSTTPVGMPWGWNPSGGTCGNVWSDLRFLDVSMSVWEYKADNTQVHHIVPSDGTNLFYFESECGSDLAVTLQGLPNDVMAPEKFLDNVTTSTSFMFDAAVPVRSVKGKLLAPDGTSPLSGVSLNAGLPCGNVPVLTGADGTFEFDDGPNHPLTWGFENFLTSAAPGLSETYVHFSTSSASPVVDLGTCPIMSNVQATCDSPSGAGLEATYFYYAHRCRVSWTTNVPAPSKVKYRKVTNPFNCPPSIPDQCWITTAEIPNPTTTHVVYIPGLEQGATYQVRAISGSSWGPIQNVTAKSEFTDISNFTFQQSLTEDEPPQVQVTCGFNTGISASCAVQIRRHQVNPLKFGTAAITGTSDPHGTSHSHDFTSFYPWGSNTETPLALGTQYDLVVTVWPGHWFPADPAAPNAQYPDGYNGYTETQIYLTFTTPRPGGGGSHYEFTVAGDKNGGMPVYKNALFANNPNPFASTTGIRFGVKEDSKVRLEIFDLQGRIVRTLANETMSPGLHEVTWDRRNANGERVNCGIYFYRLVVGEFIDTKKMVVLR